MCLCRPNVTSADAGGLTGTPTLALLPLSQHYQQHQPNSTKQRQSNPTKLSGRNCSSGWEVGGQVACWPREIDGDRMRLFGHINTLLQAVQP